MVRDAIELSRNSLEPYLFNHVMRLDVQFFDRNPVGRLITRMTSDVGTLNELFASGLVSVFGDLLVIPAAAVLIFEENQVSFGRYARRSARVLE